MVGFVGREVFTLLLWRTTVAELEFERLSEFVASIAWMHSQQIVQ